MDLRGGVDTGLVAAALFFAAAVAGAHRLSRVRDFAED
jgi:hypothetical protein